MVLLLCFGGTSHLFSIRIPICEDFSFSPQGTENEAIPARLSGGLIMIQARFNGIEGNYILDTGASHLFINQELVTDHTVKAFGLEAQVAVEKGVVSRFEIGTVVFKNQTLFKMDMKHLEAIKGCKIAGIIGSNLLRDFSLFVDYDRDLVRLENSTFQTKNNSNKVLRNFPFRWENHFPMLSVSVNEVEYAFAIDTGAEANIFSDNYEEALIKHSKNLQEGKIWSISESTTTVRNFTLTKMKCLALNYTSLKFMYSDLKTINHAYSVELDGILGYPFLRRHPFTLDFSNDRLIIWEKGNQSSVN